MFGVLNVLANWLVGLATTYLPASPFTNMSFATWSTAIGWLNWLVPVSDCLGLFDLWLLCCAAWMLYKWLYKSMGGVMGAFLGSNPSV